MCVLLKANYRKSIHVCKVDCDFKQNSDRLRDDVVRLPVTLVIFLNKIAYTGVCKKTCRTSSTDIIFDISVFRIFFIAWWIAHNEYYTAP